MSPRAYRAEIASLAEAGCRYIQMDDTNLAYLCDETHRADARARGVDPDETAAPVCQADQRSFADAPADMLTASTCAAAIIRSSWAAEGGYEPVAEMMFNELEIDAYLPRI